MTDSIRVAMKDNTIKEDLEATVVFSRFEGPLIDSYLIVGDLDLRSEDAKMEYPY